MQRCDGFHPDRRLTPLGRKMDLREGFVADLLATHPPMPQRISALMRMAYQAANASRVGQ